MLKFIKSITGRIIIGVIVAIIVGLIIGGYTHFRSYDLEGVWKVKIDYETFFSTHISRFSKCRILGEGDIYIVSHQNNYKGLSCLEIYLTPETLLQKQKFITLVLEFNNFSFSENNKYKGSVEVKLRNVDTEVITKYILPSLVNQNSLEVPTSYSFTLDVNNDSKCSGEFLGKLKDGTITTKGELLLIR